MEEGKRFDPVMEAINREVQTCRITSGRDSACRFCGKELTKRILNLGEREFFFGHNGCDCEQYRSAVEKIQAEEHGRYQKILAKEHQEKIDRLFSQSRIGARFRERTFENFIVESEWQNSALAAALDFTKRMIAGIKNTQGLLLSGKVGTGKTHIAAAVANRLMAAGIPVLFGTSAVLLGQIKQGWKNDTDTDVINEMCHIPLLIIDDVGKEYSRKENGWSWAQEQFFNVINSRYENYLPMIITTNFDMEELTESLGQAIVSRLVESCRGIRCDGEDYRMKRKTESLNVIRGGR